SIATKVRIGVRWTSRLCFGGAGGLLQRAPEQVERSLSSLPANDIALAPIVLFQNLAALRCGKCDEDRADGFLLGTAIRTCDSRDSQTVGRTQTAANTLRKRLRDGGTDRAVRGKSLSGNTEPGFLYRVTVANHAAEEIRRAAGNRGDSLRQHTARTAL